MATIKDVAKRADVSYTTVSHVINKTRFVSEEIVDRVNRAIEELGYRPNQVARSLRIHESKTIGVISSADNDPYFSEILSGIEHSSYLAGYNVIVCYSEFDVKKEKENMSMLIAKGVDAIITHCILDEEHIQELLDIDMPVVFLQQHLPEMDMDAYCTDDLTGGYLATKHLVELGHARIACLGGQGKRGYSYCQRETGWRKALTDNSIEIKEDYFVQTKMGYENGYNSFEIVMALPEPPTAIFCYNDHMAIGAIRAAADMGIKVPEDISIIGFDDLIIAAQYIPRLTTISQPKGDLGDRAVQRILQRLAEDTTQRKRHILQPRLLIRESTKKFIK